MLLEKERLEVVEAGKEMLRRGLTNGSFGNVSIYCQEEKLFAICPSGMAYEEVRPEDVAVVNLDGEQIEGRRKASSEVDMHRILYKKKQGITAVVHTHSPYATAVSCTGKELPPIHYLIAYSGYCVPCAPYCQFGTQALAEAVAETIGDNNACLLGNHGLITCGFDMRYAMDCADQIEFVARLYCTAPSFEKLQLLEPAEIDVVREALLHYGR